MKKILRDLETAEGYFSGYLLLHGYCCPQRWAENDINIVYKIS